jgi:REP element-mobilizing transposase RayT
MPWGLTRFHHSGQSHFITFCCHHRHRLFTTDASRSIFESALERVRRSFRLQVYGYVVMPEHVHLLLSEPQQGTLADALKALKQGVSRRLLPPQRAKCGLARGPACLPGAQFVRASPRLPLSPDVRPFLPTRRVKMLPPTPNVHPSHLTCDRCPGRPQA